MSLPAQMKIQFRPRRETSVMAGNENVMQRPGWGTIKVGT
jgi:hypothetical protein